MSISTCGGTRADGSRRRSECHRVASEKGAGRNRDDGERALPETPFTTSTVRYDDAFAPDTDHASLSCLPYLSHALTDHDPLLVFLFLLVLRLDRSRLPPPDLQPLRITPGLPARFVWHVEEGGSSAKRWTPPRKPRRDAPDQLVAGRRPVRLLSRTTRDEHLETNTQRRTPGYVGTNTRRPT
jgi:hypothetical protein